MKFHERHRAKQIVRQYFDSQGFVEIDSPVLIPANAIETHIDPIWAADGELRTSPELYLKRILARGLTKIYELGPVFRDEAEGRLHKREFMLLEWYRTRASLVDLVQDCQNLFQALAPEQFNQPFEVKTLQTLWLEYGNIDLKQALLEENLVQRVREAGFALREQADFSDAFVQVMGSVIEPQIGQKTPCVVTRWPREMAALSRLCEDDNLFAERFEIYYQGIELANAFLELTDPVEQRKRFTEEAKIRRQLGKKISPMDENFLSELGLVPESAGIALGFDRLLMCISGAHQIDEITNY